eukprot:270891-Pleurochrysis_carterae.AAC.3
MTVEPAGPAFSLILCHLHLTCFWYAVLVCFKNREVVQVHDTLTGRRTRSDDGTNGRERHEALPQ